MQNVLVTGGAGFIGSHLVKRLLASEDVARVTVLDALTYAGQRANLGEAMLDERLRFVRGDIRDERSVNELIPGHDTVAHLAAESHVDHSFHAGGTFLATNVMGTNTMLDAARRHGVDKFVHISTDEVYGPLPTDRATESDAMRPTVPYAASKAAADHVALSYFHSYGLPVCITRSSNNYGPAQHPEKIIPQFITRLLQDKPVTLHGQGQHMRTWLHVTDNCAAIELVMRDGVPGQTYNIAGQTELTNKELTGRILAALGRDWDLVQFGPDRPANDIRYAMTWGKIADLGFLPQVDFEHGLAETVDWFRRNPDRWAPLVRTTKGSNAAPQPAAVGA